MERAACEDTLLVVLGTSLRQAFKPDCVGFIPNGLHVRTAPLYWSLAESIMKGVDSTLAVHSLAECTGRGWQPTSIGFLEDEYATTHTSPLPKAVERLGGCTHFSPQPMLCTRLSIQTEQKTSAAGYNYGISFQVPLRQDTGPWLHA